MTILVSIHLAYYNINLLNIILQKICSFKNKYHKISSYINIRIYTCRRLCVTHTVHAFKHRVTRSSPTQNNNVSPVIDKKNTRAKKYVQCISLNCKHLVK